MMNIDSLTTADAVRLRYAYSIGNPEHPWIMLVIPFGLDVAMASPFFEFFASHYNVCTWESRSILEDSDRECEVTQFAIDHHVADLLAVLDTLHVKETILVGYCSGAGIALAAINLAPNRFGELILAHGEYTLLSDAKCTTPFAADMDTLLCLAASSDARAQVVFNKIQSERFDGVNRPAGLDQPFSKVRFLKRYAKNYLAYKSNDFTQLAREVTHPTLLLAGGKDAQVNISSSRKIQGHIRGSRLFVDPQADHYGVLTKDSPTLIAIWNYICESAYAQRQRRVYSRGL
jgi:pimeloyl-ACP methyl ester carboxylesterase